MADKGLCEHLVKVAIIRKVNLPIHEKKLTIRNRRNEKKLNDSETISEEDSDFENNLYNFEKASQD